MKVVHADGKTTTWEAKEGEGGWMDAEGPHTSENIGKTTLGFILVEVKAPPNPEKRRKITSSVTGAGSSAQGPSAFRLKFKI